MVFVKIDQDTCIECGVCYSICDEVFEGDENGKSQLVREYQSDSPDEGEVPDEIECTQEAEEECPVDSIEVE